MDDGLPYYKAGGALLQVPLLFALMQAMTLRQARRRSQVFEADDYAGLQGELFS